MLETRLPHHELGSYNTGLKDRVVKRTAQLSASQARFHNLAELASNWYWEQNETD